jgi:hypothetical protein
MTSQLSWTGVILWLLPPRLAVNWLYAAALGLASIALLLFLRRRGRSWPAAAVGALAALWLGSNLSLVYSGHMGKFGVLLFACLFLLAVDAAARSRRLDLALLAGGCAGGMFLEQADVALFFSLFLVPWAVLEIARRGNDRRRTAVLTAALMLMTGLLAARPVVGGWRQSVRDTAIHTTASAAERWAFATQWSWPPAEMFDLVAPGFWGWRSHDPDGPYRGRVGRSAGWEETGAGFENHKLDAQYLGWVPLALALVAAVAAWGRRPDASSDAIWDGRLWSIVAVAALLLAFGKYGIAYRPLWLLPGFGSVRNPIKFLQIGQLAVGILAAGGLDLVLGRDGRRRSVLLAVASGAVAAILLVMRLGSLTPAPSAEASRVLGETVAARATAVRAQSALEHGLAVSLLLAAWAVAGSRRIRFSGGLRIAAWMPATIVAVDALLLARWYVQTNDLDTFTDNPIVAAIEEELGEQRLVVTQQVPLYNAWLTYLFPYHGIRSLNIAQYPRPPSDIRSFFFGDIEPRIVWRHAAVGPILAPPQVCGAPWADTRPSRLVAVPASAGGPAGEHCLLRFELDAPRYALLGSWRPLSFDEALPEISSGRAPPLDQVLIHDAGVAPAPEGSVGRLGRVEVVSAKPHRRLLRTSSDRAAVLRISELYRPDWKATVDGEAATIHRCDLVFQAVLLPAGKHEVELLYRPRAPLLPVQLLAMAVLAVATVTAVRGRRRVSTTEIRG